jgi:hypothetical protein
MASNYEMLYKIFIPSENFLRLTIQMYEQKCKTLVSIQRNEKLQQNSNAAVVTGKSPQTLWADSLFKSHSFGKYTSCSLAPSFFTLEHISSQDCNSVSPYLGEEVCQNSESTGSFNIATGKASHA